MYFKWMKLKGLIYNTQLATFSVNSALLETLSCQVSVYAVEVVRSSQSDRRSVPSSFIVRHRCACRMHASHPRLSQPLDSFAQLAR